MNTGQKYVWMKVDLKDNEIPLEIASTHGQLAYKCGVKPETIRNAISRAKKNGYRCQWVRVEDDEE